MHWGLKLLCSFMTPGNEFWVGLLRAPLYHWSSCFNYREFEAGVFVDKNEIIDNRGYLLIALNSGLTGEVRPVIRNFGDRELNGEVEFMCVGTRVDKFDREEITTAEEIILDGDSVKVRFSRVDIECEPDVVYVGFYIRSVDIIAWNELPVQYEKVKISFVPEIIVK